MSDAERGWVDVERLAGWFRLFAEGEVADLPLYHRVSLAVAEEPDLLAVMAGAQPGQWRPVLFFAALHTTVLAHPDDELSQWFPTVTGRPAPDGDPVPALRRFLDDHGREVAHLVATRSTQTNEVNRACLWFAALRAAVADPVAAGHPIALIEVGASAGLLLHLDEYAYDFGDGVRRGSDIAGVELACEVLGGAPPLDHELPPIVARLGIDLHPVDATDPVETRWLRACVWAEQADRHRRLDAALAHAVTHPVEIRRDDALDGLADAIESMPDDAHVVVVHSWVLTYVAKDRRPAFARLLDLAGTGRTLTWISAEGAGVVPGVTAPEGLSTGDTVVGMSRWRDGARHDDVVAVCHPHLRWLDWFGVAELG